jgi:hypothetical protein
MSCEELARDSIVVRGTNDILCRDLEGELFLVNAVDQRGYVLNGIGARVWQLLEQPTTVATVLEQLMGEFAVDAQTCELDVREFLLQLRAAELIRIASSPAHEVEK